MKSELLEDKAFLDNALTIIKNKLSLEAFNEYLVNSGLEVPIVVKKGYPNKTEFKNVEIYVNTSSYGDSLRYTTEDAVIEVAIIVDVFLPDNKVMFIWKYQDAVREWLEQFLVGRELIEIVGRTYTKADGESANHFTLLLDVLADVLCDNNPLEE